MYDYQANPLLARKEVEQVAEALLTPLIPLMSPGKARIHLGETGAVYDAQVAGMEAFARPLWAIVPMLAGGCEAAQRLWPHWREGIIHGVDPQHPEYWGDVGSYDQRQVEMAVFGMGMAIAPETFFFDLPEVTQQQLHRWLDQINHTEMPNCNWTFFRVLVNIGFMACGLPYSEERLRTDFDLIEEHYVGDGWYHDAERQRDYYTLWAFQYYGLVYARVMRERNAAVSALYAERGRLIAPDFAAWFDSTGEALPYGRSLTYRFSQGAFFAALAFAEEESAAVPYGVMKRLLLGNLRKWLRLPIFTRDGVLTIGYHYPNLVMAEGYNAPGSPYWGMKTFLCLALPEEHPFWQAEEADFAAPALQRQPHMRMLITRSESGDHVIGYPAGNSNVQHSHPEAKYEKFAYSTVFGFSVPKCHKYLGGGAYDSMLVLSEDGMSWHQRFDSTQYELTDRCAASVWYPFKGVTVRTEVYPAGEWHLRIHRICTDRALLAAEGGFAIARGPEDERCKHVTEGTVDIAAPWGTSAIKGLTGYASATMVYAEPNTNLIAPRTLIPTLQAELAPGEHVLACVVLGTRACQPDWADHVPQELLDLWRANTQA